MSLKWKWKPKYWKRSMGRSLNQGINPKMSITKPIFNKETKSQNNMSNISEYENNKPKYGKKDRGINPKDLTKSTHII